MNILPKKSWHVRTRKNIEKVRRDEANAAEEEKRRLARVALAEQEARTEFLRKRARQAAGGHDDEDGLTQPVPRLDINDLFSDVKEGKGDKRKNAERLAEEKFEQEKWEKQIGLLQYLGDSAGKPWYLDSHVDRMKLIDKEKEEKDNHSQPEPGPSQTTKSKHYQYDPLNTMNMYLDQMKATQSEKEKKLKQASTSSSSNKKVDLKSQDVKRQEESSKRKEKHEDDRKKAKKLKKKHKKHKKSSRKSSSSSESEEDDKSRAEAKLKLEALRAERLRREEIEKERTRQLLKSKTPMRSDTIADDRQRNYHTQFNPHLARR